MAMTQSNRRSFMKVAGALPAAAIVPGVVLASEQRATHAVPILLRRDFEPLVGQVFTVEGNPAAALTLVALDDVPHCANRDRSFRAVFAVTAAEGLSQNLWQLSHPAVGTHDVFLSPNDAAGRVVEAVFNRS